MLRALLVQLTAMVVLTGFTAYGLHEAGGAIPTLNRDVGLAVTAAYVGGWLLMTGLALRPGLPRDVRRVRGRRTARYVTLGGDLALIAGLWLAGPYIDEALRLLIVIFQVGTVTLQVASSVQRPPARGGRGLELLVVPGSIGLYFALHWERLSPAILLFVLTHATIVLTLRARLQGAVDGEFAARRTAEAERDARMRFLASASHDLGQPLQAARLSFEQVLRSDDAGQRQKAARRVTWAFDTTEQLLRRILDHLRLEAGMVEPRIGPTAVGPLIARVAELNEPAARLAGVEIVALPSRLEAAADAELTERALGNLVGNAIRHAKARRVLVGARRIAGRVRLWVIDDGVGVGEADRSRLFEDFVQGSDHGDEIRGGFGLGLASARRMAALMAGAVGLDPHWAKGSAFWLELPAAGAKAP